MERRQLVERLGIVLGGVALALSAGALLPDAAAPAGLVMAPQAQEVVYADPDGAGPLPLGQARLAGSLVVDLRDGMSPEQVRALGRAHGVNLRYNSANSLDAALTVTYVGEEHLEAVMRDLAQDPCVESVEPNYLYQCSDDTFSGGATLEAQASATAANTPNDPLYKYQWNMDMIGAPRAWTWSTGKGAVVAVVDTGVAWKAQDNAVAMEDLAQTTIVPGYDFVKHNDLGLDDNCHGTHVAGTIAQSTNNNLGVAGVAHGAGIMPVKVLSAHGSGTLSDICDGIRFAADHHASVINMSLGGSMPASTLERAVRYAYNRGTFVVCAAGNEGKPRVSYPAGYPQSFAVSALDSAGKLSWYSNHGPNVDVAAPGGDTRSDLNGDGMVDGVVQNTIAVMDPSRQGYFAFQGTSMACPHVAGVAALVAAQGVTNPAAIAKVICSTATSRGREGRQAGYGAGVVNAQAATYRAGFVYGAGRLCCALVVLALAVASFLRRRCGAGIMLSAPGAVLASSGLFFLPVLLPMSFPHCELVTMGMPAWGLALFGTAGHGSPLLYSCLVPILLSLLAQENKWLRYAVVGVAAGFAGCLLFEAVALTVYVHYVPHMLARLWLLGNGLFCLFLAQVLTEDTVAAE